MIVYINGSFFDEKNAKISIFDRGFIFGEGAFSTIRTYNGKMFRLTDHINRLFDSCKKLGFNPTYSKKEITEEIKKTFKKSKLREAKIRVIITKGIIEDFENKKIKNTLVIIVSDLPKKNNKNYENGVSAITVKSERSFPKSKTMNMDEVNLAKLTAIKKRVFEAILINYEGFVTEATTSNLFIVKNKKLITPKTMMLEGITRKTIIELAKKEKIKVILKKISKKELLTADEAFFAGTTKEIVPIKKIDNKKIGKEKIGAITKQLLFAFKKYVENY